MSFPLAFKRTRRRMPLHLLRMAEEMESLCRPPPIYLSWNEVSTTIPGVLLRCGNKRWMLISGAVTYVELDKDSVSIIDSADVPLVDGRSWHCCSNNNTNYYAKSQRLKMHRLILGITDPKQLTDHINGNGLDNRRSNLRVCTPRENVRNTRKARGGSKYKGVHRRGDYWCAAIRAGRRLKILGMFVSEIEAALVYDRAAIGYFGEFAWLNFPSLSSTQIRPVVVAKSVETA